MARGRDSRSAKRLIIEQSFLAERAYGADWFRDALKDRAICPGTADHKAPETTVTYHKWRNRIDHLRRLTD